ncbi:hypothetical protein IQ07DRAFT_558086 [Pyrenochaeta sp. DS3sAY3a]|nr:hypothetical protein IQ07DRAFT_558086 [Pyrenochaeta sp. DS3sAY3a]
MPETEQTKDGAFEDIEFHTWEPVDTDRYMSWKGGNGQVSVGVKVLKQQNASETTNDAVLQAGHKAVVFNMRFKLKSTKDEEEQV